MLRSEFWQNVMTLVSGSLVAQLIGVVSIVVLPRLYPDTDFGIFGFFVAVVAVTVVIINGGYDHAVMLPEEETMARSLTGLSLSIAFLGTAVFLFIAMIAGEWILNFAEVPELLGWHYLIPLSILLEGISQPLRTLLNRHKIYRGLSYSKIARSLLLVVTSIILGVNGDGFSGLIIGYLAGQMAGLVVLAGYAISQTGIRVRHFGKGELMHASRNYSDFPRYSILSTWLNTASKHLPFYLLIPLFDAGVAGQFSQADRILTLPVVLVAMSIGNVFYQHANQASLLGPEALAAETRKTFFRLLIPAVPFLAITMVWGPELFGWVLGAEWTEAGVYARWLMPWMFMVFIASPLAYLIDIRRKLREFLFFNIALFFVRLAALWLGGQYFGPEGTMVIYGLSGMTMVGLQLLYLLHIGGVFRNSASKN